MRITYVLSLKERDSGEVTFPRFPSVFTTTYQVIGWEGGLLRFKETTELLQFKRGGKSVGTTGVVAVGFMR